jgi:DNA-binding Xre family transcriptional regulator
VPASTFLPRLRYFARFFPDILDLDSYSLIASASMLRVKEIRLSIEVSPGRPLSREALARRAGVGYKTIQRVEETGEATASTLRKIADALGVPVGDLFENNHDVRGSEQ